MIGVLVMYHGTPRSLAELPAFYTEIRRGHPPSREQLEDLERRYLTIGGLSPLAERTAAQVAGIERSLEELRPGRYFVTAGAKYSEPRIEDAVDELGRRAIERAVGIVLAPHSASVSVGEYTRRAKEAAAASGLSLEVIDRWHLEPGLISLLGDRVTESVASLLQDPDSVEIVFSAHSVPVRTVGQGDTYPQQVHETAEAVAKSADVSRWRVAWQSAGRTDEEWLGPDVLEVISELRGAGATGVVVCPVGFVSDHLEILYDLDVDAAARAREAGLAFARTRSLNDDPRLSALLARVVAAADAGD